MARILIADHVSERRSILCTFLRADEHVIIPVTRESEALKSLKDSHPDLIILEGTVSGSKLVTEARTLDSGIGVIMLMAGPPTVEQLVELMNQGVSDVLVSPLDINDVQAKVERALGRRSTTDAVQIRFHELVGFSSRMQQVFRKIVKAAANDSPVLITGEPGTGKQLVAEQIHRLSARRTREFRVVHCAGLSAQELESELFGHEPGVLPWAVTRRQGQIELGDGGTIYIDEAGALSPLHQAKLLRLIDEQKLQRLGGSQTLSVNVRVIAGARYPLLHQVQQGSFRHDLFYRLGACEMELPPLRARAEDVPDLAELFLGRYDVQIAGEAMEILMNYSWPGNVDELKNSVEQALNLCDGNRVEIRDLPNHVLRAVAQGTRRHKYIPSAKAKGE